MDSTSYALSNIYNMLLRDIFDHQSTRYAQVDTIPEL
jgi:hypothetical protein